jgi:hypothetical protein
LLLDFFFAVFLRVLARGVSALAVLATAVTAGFVFFPFVILVFVAVGFLVAGFFWTAGWLAAFLAVERAADFPVAGF